MRKEFFTNEPKIGFVIGGDCELPSFQYKDETITLRVGEEDLQEFLSHDSIFSFDQYRSSPNG